MKNQGNKQTWQHEKRRLRDLPVVYTTVGTRVALQLTQLSKQITRGPNKVKVGKRALMRAILEVVVPEMSGSRFDKTGWDLEDFKRELKELF